MRNFEIKNIKSHPSQSLAKANASRDLQINFNQAEDALTIPAESRHDYKCGYAAQRGRSMIEMLGVLAIIGVLSVGGIAGYSKAMTKYRINKTIEQITLIAGNVRTFFAPQRSYDGLDNSNNKWIIQKAKLVPEEMYGSEGSSYINLINAFGESVYLIYENKAKDGDNQAFYIRYDLATNEEACIELLSNDWTNAGVKAYRVAGGPGYDNKLFKAPLDVATAVDTCSKAKEQGYWIEIRFYFDIDINSTYWSSKTWEN